MKLLLDTHALIWLAEDDAQLTDGARRAINDEDNRLVCSVASIWELAIKARLGKIRFGARLDTNFRRRLEDSGFMILPVEYAHAARVAALPWHHRDPFDRLLVAQSLAEGLAIVSHDRQLDGYGIRRIW